MKPQWTTIARFCTVLGSVISSVTVGTSSCSWHSIPLLVSLVLPTLAVLVDHYRVYVASAVVCSAGTLLEACRVVSWPFDLHLMSTSLLLLTAILSLPLAIEDVTLRVSADILSEKWSQSQMPKLRIVKLGIVCYSYALLSVS